MNSVQLAGAGTHSIRSEVPRVRKHPRNASRIQDWRLTPYDLLQILYVSSVSGARPTYDDPPSPQLRSPPAEVMASNNGDRISPSISDSALGSVRSKSGSPGCNGSKIPEIVVDSPAAIDGEARENLDNDAPLQTMPIQATIEGAFSDVFQSPLPDVKPTDCAAPDAKECADTVLEKRTKPVAKRSVFFTTEEVEDIWNIFKAHSKGKCIHHILIQSDRAAFRTKSVFRGSASPLAVRLRDSIYKVQRALSNTDNCYALARILPIKTQWIKDRGKLHLAQMTGGQLLQALPGNIRWLGCILYRLHLSRIELINHLHWLESHFTDSIDDCTVGRHH